jgi:molybdate transport system substrate-binding protein
MTFSFTLSAASSFGCQVPLDAYPRMEQGGIILKSAKDLETARAFRDFVLGDHGREVLKHYGFYLPEK